jgi:hypothetical protein
VRIRNGITSTVYLSQAEAAALNQAEFLLRGISTDIRPGELRTVGIRPAEITYDDMQNAARLIRSILAVAVKC